MPGTAGPNLGMVTGWVAHETGWGVDGFNPNFDLLDGIIFLSVISAIITVPPISPADGDRYVVGPSATGVWATHDDDIAIYRGAAWVFYTPKLSWRAFNEDTGGYIRFDGAAWVSDSGAGLQLIDLSDVNVTSIADRDILVYDNGTSKWLNERQKYILGSSVSGVLTASQLLLSHRFSKAVTIPANFGAYLGHTSQAGGTAVTTASTVVNVDKAASATPNTFSNVGTITFAIGTVTPTFASSGGTAISFAQGDVIRIVGPASADATFAGFYATIVGFET